MTKVFVSVTMSLDGFVAPPGRMERLQGAQKDEWFAKWSKLQAYLFHLKVIHEKLQIPGEGETGGDNDVVTEVFDRTGVTIMGKRMFDAGEHSWPEEAPFHSPVFVVTHEKRAPWPRPGGTTFHFVNDGIESALRQARAVCPPEKDIRIGGGGETIDEYLRAGLVDELQIALAPMIMGKGIRMLDGLGDARIELRQLPTPASRRVTHLRYEVVRT